MTETIEEFLRLARTYRVVPVWREVIADAETPVSAFAKLVGNSSGYLLESVERAQRWGRYSFVGRAAPTTLISRSGTLDIEGTPLPIATDQGILDAIEDLLRMFRAPQSSLLPPFHGGLVGYLGYDVAREIEHLPNIPKDDRGWPNAIVSVGGQVAAFDHYRQTIFLIENCILSENMSDEELHKRFREAQHSLDKMEDDLAKKLVAPPSKTQNGDIELPETTSPIDKRKFMEAVARAQEYMKVGDIFQVVLSQRFDLTGSYDPFSVYRVLRSLNPSPYMYLMQHPETTVVGSSPESMVQLRDGEVVIRPIAGTRRRGATEEDDARLAEELSNDPKERAEHVMLLDLARNDIGRVVKFGTEKVDESFTLEHYSHMMHLTSQASGMLRKDKSPIDVLRATFPAGTVSGAPKVRAMEIIDELEPTKRGPYGGVVGYFDFSGNLDTAIAIRTMIWRNGKATLQAGAGLVVDSDPELEDLECHNKAQALLTAATKSQTLSPFGDE